MERHERPDALGAALRDAAARLDAGDTSALFTFVGTFGRLREYLPGWHLKWERGSTPPRFGLVTTAGADAHLPASTVAEVVTAGLAIARFGRPDDAPETSDDGSPS